MKEEGDRLFRMISKTHATESVRRVSDYNYYQTLYYKERILPLFNERWEAAVVAAKEKDEKPPCQISIRHQVVAECLQNESDEEKARIHELAEADYQRRLAAETEALRPPSTPEEYAEYVYLFLSGSYSNRRLVSSQSLRRSSRLSRTVCVSARDWLFRL